MHPQDRKFEEGRPGWPAHYLGILIRDGGFSPEAAEAMAANIQFEVSVPARIEPDPFGTRKLDKAAVEAAVQAQLAGVI